MQQCVTQQWQDLILDLQLNSELAAMAWFSSKDELLAANLLMCNFLGTTPDELKPTYFFVNPDFKRLQALVPDAENCVFKGLLTIGNFSNISYVLNAQIFKRDEVLFVYAEADTIALFEDNKKMSRLNQQVNNLQRQLLKEKSKLEHTLAELKETQQQLIQSEKMNALGQMVAGVAHEINNPIAYVTNNLYELQKYTTEIFDAFTDLEREFETEEHIKAKALLYKVKAKYDFEYLTQDVSDVLSESQSGVERVKRIVEDLRRFSRLDESEVKHIDLVENLQSTLSIVKAELDKKMIDFKVHSPEVLFADCYPGQLNQAILNILINAIYAVEDKGIISLSLTQENDVVSIAVSDNGCGMDDVTLAKLFNPFYTTKPVGTGTGLGLSITYKIITDLHQGSIQAVSRLGHGATLTISLPTTIK